MELIHLKAIKELNKKYIRKSSYSRQSTIKKFNGYYYRLLFVFCDEIDYKKIFKC